MPGEQGAVFRPRVEGNQYITVDRAGAAPGHYFTVHTGFRGAIVSALAENKLFNYRVKNVGTEPVERDFNHNLGLPKPQGHAITLANGQIFIAIQQRRAEDWAAMSKRLSGDQRCLLGWR